MRWIVALLLLPLAGCLSDTEEPGSPIIEETSALATHVLVDALEPDAFDSPTFAPPAVLGTGGPIYGIGEPGIWAHLDGTLYAAAPGCDDGPYYLGPSLPGSATCAHGIVWRSEDGASWDRLNTPDDGYLPGTEGSEAEANGDNDVAVDAAGNLYASNLGGGGIQTFRSADNGTSWSFIGDVVPERAEGESQDWADRQWMAAASPGHLIMAWMGGNRGNDDLPDRAVAVNTTFDAGQTWTGTTYLGETIGWIGPVQFAPNGIDAYVPFTQRIAPANDLVVLNGGEFTMRLGHTADGGRTWSIIDTNLTWQAPATGQHWSGVNMAPAFDVTGDGTLVVAWSQDIAEAGLTSLSTVVRVSTSSDGGAAWSAPFSITPALSAAIMPWVTGGAGDRFAVTYFLSPTGLDPDYAALTWDVVATVVDGDRQVDAVIEANVHEGPICSRGGGCIGPVDRALLDYFEADLLPDGRLVVIYPANPSSNLFGIDIRVAIQDGGTPLLVR